MNLYIDHKSNDTGKSKFISRLVPALEDIGVRCSFKPTRADIQLSVYKFKKRKAYGGIPRVLRMDGVHLRRSNRNRWRNNDIRRSIKTADAVIWQSKFAKNMLQKVLKVRPNRNFVIHNGADPADYRVEPMPSEYGRNIILCAKWFRADGTERKFKRLGPMLEICRDYVEQHSGEVGVWVAGNTRKYKSTHPAIRHLGRIPEEQLRRYLVASDVMLYLAYIDWCPNAVVEALAAGTPVICPKYTAMAELGCMEIKTDKKVKCKLRSHSKPPAFEYAPVWECLDQVLASPHRVKAPKVDIHMVAKQYKYAFKKVLK